MQSTKSSLAAAGTPPYKLQPSRARLRIRVVNSDDVQMGSRQGTKSMARPSSGSSADAQPRSGTASKRSRQALEENSRSKRQELQPEAAAARVAAASSQPPGGVVSKKPPGSPADVQASPSMGTNGQKPSAVTADLEQNSPRHQPSKKTKKRKKNGKVNKDCPVWKATVAALRAKNPAAAWAAYQSNKAEHDFKVSELQALAVLFLGAPQQQHAYATCQHIYASHTSKKFHDTAHFLQCRVGAPVVPAASARGAVYSCSG